MRCFRIATIIAVLACAAALTGSAVLPRSDNLDWSDREKRLILQHKREPLPPDPTNRFADDPRAAHFGQYLFFDTRLSSNGEMSCATCHDPQQAFVDGKQRAEGLKTLSRHSPTLLNVAYNRWFFWDGRADTLWSQVIDPIERQDEFASNRAALAHTIFANDDLRRGYQAVFGPLPDLTNRKRFPKNARPVPDDEDHPHHQAWIEMDEDDRNAVNEIIVNVSKALAAYERVLISGESSFDRFARGLDRDDATAMQALSPSAQRGLRLFIGEANCRLCHIGPQFSDGEFHNTSVAPLDGGMPRDPGRYEGVEALLKSPFNAAGRYSDAPDGALAERLEYLRRSPETWGQFKTPSLRDVARTAPYMHQGQLETLRAVVEFYSTREGALQIGHHQETILQPSNLTASEIDDLVSFLNSLTGRKLPDRLLRQPASPRSDQIPNRMR